MSKCLKDSKNNEEDVCYDKYGQDEIYPRGESKVKKYNNLHIPTKLCQ